jgi:phosphoribosyl 1,2-cyclic phosphodiesterase/CheY-like chemotaxis protein
VGKAKKKTLRFHVVDDDPAERALLTRLLRKAGYAVTEHESGETALRAIPRDRPDGVIIDLMMPGMDGLDLLKELRGRKALTSTRIIIVAGKPYEFDRTRALKLGADSYVVKPLDPALFLDEIKRVMDDRMELTFWGVRGTLPVPGPQALRYGGHTSCVTLAFPKGQLFIFDAGSGIKPLGDTLLAQRRARLSAKIFVSHPHWDHINALPFFAPLYIQGNEFEILGPAHSDVTMRQLISHQMDGVYFPVNIREFGARVYFRDLKEETVTIDGITVRTKLLNHPGKCLGYRVEYNGRAVCYITDNELYLPDNPYYNPRFAKRLAEFVGDADALITDTTYSDEEYRSKVGWGHSCVGQVARLAAAARVKTLYLFHHDPDQDDDAIDAKLAAAQAFLKKKAPTVRCIAPSVGTSVKI